MPLRIFQCPLCGSKRETLRKKTPRCNHNQDEEGEPIELIEMEQLLTSPTTKMMETTDPYTKKTRLKDQTRILKERARNHSRDVEIDEMIQLNRNNHLTGIHFLNKSGERRKKVDDK